MAAAAAAAWHCDYAAAACHAIFLAEAAAVLVAAYYSGAYEILLPGCCRTKSSPTAFKAPGAGHYLHRTRIEAPAPLPVVMQRLQRPPVMLLQLVWPAAVTSCFNMGLSPSQQPDTDGLCCTAVGWTCPGVHLNRYAAVDQTLVALESPWKSFDSLQTSMQWRPL